MGKLPPPEDGCKAEEEELPPDEDGLENIGRIRRIWHDPMVSVWPVRLLNEYRPKHLQNASLFEILLYQI